MRHSETRVREKALATVLFSMLTVAQRFHAHALLWVFCYPLLALHNIKLKVHVFYVFNNFIDGMMCGVVGGMAEKIPAPYAVNNKHEKVSCRKTAKRHY